MNSLLVPFCVWTFLTLAGYPLAAADGSPMSAEALRQLVRSGTAKEVGAAVTAGADLSGMNSDHRTALIEAVMWGREEAVVAALLEAGSSPEQRGWVGRTALMWVGWNGSGRPAVVAQLIAAGAHPDARDDYGSTALHTLVEVRDLPEVVRALIAGGVPVQAVNQYGWSALDLARKHDRTATCAALLAAGATSGGDVLAVVSTAPANEVAAFLADHPLDLNANHPGQSHWPSFTPMVEAASNRDPAVIPLLLTLGGKLAIVDTFGQSPLYAAACYNPNPAVTRKLLELGASPDGAPGSGEPPLHAAIGGFPPKIEVVKALLDAGADVNVRDDKGRTALDLAEKESTKDGMAEVISALRAADAQSGGSLWNALENGTATDITLLLAHGTNLTARDASGLTPLIWAVTCGRDAAVVSQLLAAGADVHAADSSGRNALMFVGQDLTVIKVLVDAGLTIDSGDVIGRTALYLSLYNPHPERIAGLLAAGADPLAAAHDGSTPLSMARERGDAAVIRLLEGALLKIAAPANGF